MHKIKEMLMDEIYEYEEKAKMKSGGKLSAGDLETLHKLTDTVKNIDKIEMLEDGAGYSEAQEYMGDGRIYDRTYEDGGTSYARGRGRSAKRDSRGRYSRDGAKDHMISKLDEMMDMAATEDERRAIRKCINTLEDM